MTAPRRIATAALAAAALLALWLALAPPASAAPRTIASFGHGAGRVWDPVGVAVDRSTGDLYVADGNNKRVDRFDSAGHFLLAWGWGVADGKSQQLQTCGPESGRPSPRCFEAAREGGDVAQGPGAVTPEAVMVGHEGSEGGETYVYAVDRGRHRVTKFGPQGEFVFMVGKGVDKTTGAGICRKEDIPPEGTDECGAGAAGSGPGELATPYSLAIDPAGDVWVGDTDRLVEFEADGAPGGEIPLPGAGDTKALAIDSAGDFYVKSASASLPGIRKLAGPEAAAPGELLEVLDEAGSPAALAVDGKDDVYVGDKTAPYRFLVFKEGQQVSQFGAGQVIGAPGGESISGGNALAVDEATGTLYAASSRSAEAESVVQAFDIPEPGPLPQDQRAGGLEPTAATLQATLNPEGEETEYRFEYDTSPYLEGEAGHGTAVPVPDASLPASFEEAPVSAHIEGLVPDTAYHFRLCATNATASVCGPDTEFKTPTAVGIDAQWASGVAAHSASLNAELNPFGVAAEWWVEYGTGEAYGSSTAKAALPASFGDIPVAPTLTGLAPNTTYHYRFAASDERDGTPYTAHGAGLSFTTGLSGLGFSLADGRAWEMVSPAQKYGALIWLSPEGEGLQQAADDGEALAYLSLNSIEPHPEGSRVIESSSVLARRGPGGAWSNRDITPPHAEVSAIEVGRGLEYKLFSANLERALLEPQGAPPLGPGAVEGTPYARTDSSPPAYEPLLSTANTPPESAFGEAAPVHVQGASPDLRHVLLVSQAPLTEAPAAANSLYEWAGGSIEPVSVKPAGEGGATVAAAPGSGKASVRGAISADGSRVFFSADGALYVRDTSRGETVRLDTLQPGAFGTGKAEPLFQAASADGRFAFFTDTQNLTEGANEEGADLYRCEVTVEEGELGCELSDLTAQVAHFGESAEVQGLLPGIATDGASAYLVASGVLDEEPNGEGEAASPGQPNLYRWREGEGTRFIATLGEGDNPDWGGLSGGSRAFLLSAAASPSGRYLAFMSQRSLTGYDNRDALTREPDEELFRYDAAANGGEGELTCASCNPSGAAPHGLRGEMRKAYNPQGLWSGRALAATLPEATKLTADTISLYRPRAVQDDGRLFFNAADSLVPADSNGTWDAYEYEPGGVGSCSASSGGAATSRSSGGCVSLLSSGAGEEESAFLDASVGGHDVFFISSAQLSVTDVDHVADVYDARTDGVPARLEPHPECLGEACQPPPVPPDDKTPASSTFRGPGNLTEAAKPRCPKGKRKVKRKGKVRCVKRARHRKHHRRHSHRHSHRNGRSRR
jgi:hypothetical protein